MRQHLIQVAEHPCNSSRWGRDCTRSSKTWLKAPILQKKSRAGDDYEQPRLLGHICHAQSYVLRQFRDFVTVVGQIVARQIDEREFQPCSCPSCSAICPNSTGRGGQRLA